MAQDFFVNFSEPSFPTASVAGGYWSRRRCQHFYLGVPTRYREVVLTP